jgi:phosphohistidine phosphatase
MDVMIVRHAIAVDREEATVHGMADRDRPLTKKGRERARRAFKRLAKRTPALVSLLTSPLARAVQTAELVGKAFDIGYEETTALLPDAAPSELAELLAEDAGVSPVAVVGHEPHLSQWVGWALTGKARSVVELRKAGACLVRFEDAPRPGQGRLVWLSPPSLSRSK